MSTGGMAPRRQLSVRPATKIATNEDDLQSQIEAKLQEEAAETIYDEGDEGDESDESDEGDESDQGDDFEVENEEDKKEEATSKNDVKVAKDDSEVCDAERLCKKPRIHCPTATHDCVSSSDGASDALPCSQRFQNLN